VANFRQWGEGVTKKRVGEEREEEREVRLVPKGWAGFAPKMGDGGLSTTDPIKMGDTGVMSCLNYNSSRLVQISFVCLNTQTF